MRPDGMRPDGPTLAVGAVLVGFQVGIAALYALALAFLPISPGSTSWVPAVAVMVGALSFASWKGKTRPELITPRCAHIFARYAAAGQLALAACVGALGIGQLGEDFNRASLVWLVPVALLFGGGLSYVLTLFGFRTARRALERAQASRAVTGGEP